MEKREYLEQLVAHDYTIVIVDEEPHAVRGKKVLFAKSDAGELAMVTLIGHGHGIYDCHSSWLPRPVAMTIAQKKLYKRVLAAA